MTESTCRIRVYGIVQGVGFRPTVSRHAAAAGIRGSVSNCGPYVEIFAQGLPQHIDTFLKAVKGQPPKRAVILKMDVKPVLDPPIFTDFSIIESEKKSGEIFISPDIAICEECSAELYDPKNRRYLHPFINCTCCGPRMTILDALPYDRERTSMKKFPMCPACQDEYHSPKSRRYDAQPVCCPDCGPQVYLLPLPGKDPASGRAQITPHGSTSGSTQDTLYSDPPGKTQNTLYSDPRIRMRIRPDAGSRHRPGNESSDEIDQRTVTSKAAITAVRKTILAGGIAAVKGIGGFHLCCDATNTSAVRLLRSRKHRPVKPFAVMMRNFDTVQRECRVLPGQEEILTGHQKPILLLRQREDSSLSPEVAPGNPMTGVMLPYAPIHLLLFDFDDGLQMPDCLVMTSGNPSGAPICREDTEAQIVFKDLCDCVLSHDRDIRIRADDSVMDYWEGKPYMIRRSRGYAPLPFMISRDLHGKVLAIGGELKNSFCISSDNLLYLSPYIGDLSDLRTVQALEESIGRFQTLLEITPEAAACDLHPGYNSVMLARDTGLPVIGVQHHYAHILSCMAENDFLDPVLGVSFDGTGYGSDGSIWGGELLLCDLKGFQRLGSIHPFLQVGADASSRDGWRIAVSMIQAIYKDRDRTLSVIRELDLCDPQTAGALMVMADRRIQTVPSTSAGRLYDAVSAILGICKTNTYEGEAAAALQYHAQHWADTHPESEELKAAEELTAPDQEDDFLILPTDRLFADLLNRRRTGEDPDALAFIFHRQLAAQITAAVCTAAKTHRISTVALSGGVFVNRLLLDLTVQQLRKAGLYVLTHSLVPANDGGLALGQALAALYTLSEPES